MVVGKEHEAGSVAEYRCADVVFAWWEAGDGLMQATSMIVSWAEQVHVEVFENFISICNTGRNEYALKLKGTKKCNCRFVDFGANASSFSIIKTIQDLTIR